MKSDSQSRCRPKVLQSKFIKGNEEWFPVKSLPLSRRSQVYQGEWRVIPSADAIAISAKSSLSRGMKSDSQLPGLRGGNGSKFIKGNEEWFPVVPRQGVGVQQVYQGEWRVIPSNAVYRGSRLPSLSRGMKSDSQSHSSRLVSRRKFIKGNEEWFPVEPQDAFKRVQVYQGEWRVIPSPSASR